MKNEKKKKKKKKKKEREYYAVVGVQRPTFGNLIGHNRVPVEVDRVVVEVDDTVLTHLEEGRKHG